MKPCRHRHGFPYSWASVRKEIGKRNRGRQQGARFTAQKCGRHWHISKTAKGGWPPLNRGLAFYADPINKADQ